MNRNVQTVQQEFVAGNHFDKYRSRNPLHQMLVRSFVSAARRCVSTAAPGSVIEIGCASGDLSHCLFDLDCERHATCNALRAAQSERCFPAMSILSTSGTPSHGQCC